MNTNVISIDVVTDIISASYTGGQYKGKEVHEILNEKINGVTSGSLMLIDFLKANPLDYVFCRYAFGPIIQAIQQNSKPIIFKMQEIHKLCFYGGILKHITGERPRNKSVEELESIFINEGYHTMVVIDGKSTVDFIGNKDSIENSILGFVNESRSVSSRDIINSKKEFKPEIIIESLSSLNKKGFILIQQNGEEKYCSVYKLLNSK